jgi:hypothetical protein
MLDLVTSLGFFVEETDMGALFMLKSGFRNLRVDLA